MPMREKLACD